MEPDRWKVQCSPWTSAPLSLPNESLPANETTHFQPFPTHGGGLCPTIIRLEHAGPGCQLRGPAPGVASTCHQLRNPDRCSRQPSPTHNPAALEVYTDLLTKCRLLTTNTYYVVCGPGHMETAVLQLSVHLLLDQHLSPPPLRQTACLLSQLGTVLILRPERLHLLVHSRKPALVLVLAVNLRGWKECGSCWTPGN